MTTVYISEILSLDQIKKSVGKFVEVKHKKVEQSHGRSLRKLFEQLAWRTSPAAVLLYISLVRDHRHLRNYDMITLTTMTTMTFFSHILTRRYTKTPIMIEINDHRYIFSVFFDTVVAPKWIKGKSRFESLCGSSTRRWSKPLSVTCATFLSSWPDVLRQLRCFNTESGISYLIICLN